MIASKVITYLGKTAIPAIRQFGLAVKWIVFIFFIITIPFALYDYFEVSNIYKEPKIFSIDDAHVRVRGVSRSPMTIAVRKDGKVVFLSSCRGLEEHICRVSKYYYSWYAVSEVGVLEVSPQKGVIKYIEFYLDGEEKEVIYNRLADNYANNYRIDIYGKYLDILYVMIFSIVASFFYILVKMFFPNRVLI